MPSELRRFSPSPPSPFPRRWHFSNGRREREGGLKMRVISAQGRGGIRQAPLLQRRGVISSPHFTGAYSPPAPSRESSQLQKVAFAPIVGRLFLSPGDSACERPLLASWGEAGRRLLAGFRGKKPRHECREGGAPPSPPSLHTHTHPCRRRVFCRHLQS